MAYTTGSATNYDDFITKIKDDAIASGFWTENVDAVQESEGVTSREIILSAADVSVGFKERSTVSDTYNYHVMVSNGYSGSSEFYEQAGSSTIDRSNGQRPAIYQVNNDSTTYHLMCSQGRIACIYTTRGRWFSFYLGKFLPYATPAQYPRPHFVGGNVDYRADENSTGLLGSRNYFTANSATASPRIKFNDVWYNFRASWDNFGSGCKFVGIAGGGGDELSNLFKDKSGNSVRFPCIFRTGEDIGDYHLGELENCYLVTPNGNSGGGTIVEGGDTYRVCHDIDDADHNNLAILEE